MKFPKLRLVLRHNSKDYDILHTVDGITWSGDYKQAARTLDFDMLYPTNDVSVVKSIVPVVGDKIYFYCDKEQLFQGIVWTVDTSENNQFMQVTCFDVAVYASKSTLAYNLKDITPESAAKKVCSDLKIPQGTFETTNITYNNVALGKSGYDIILAGYTEAMKKNNNKYMIRAMKGLLNVIKKGVVKVPITLDSTVNVFNAQFNETLDGMINKVIVYDDTGGIKHTEQNTKWQEAYGILQSAISYNEKEDNVLLAKKELKDTSKKCSVEGFGDVRAISGNAITLKVPHTKLVGLFYIDSDSHNWKNETYTMNLTIAFENLMDEVDVQKEDSNTSSSSQTHAADCPANGINNDDADKDWGHSVTAEQLNAKLGGKLAGLGATFVKLSNIYKVNPALMATIAMHETGNGTSNAIKEKNNMFGMMSSSGLRSYSSVNDGIKAGISNLSRNYIYIGKKSIDAIQRKYAPIGASNDGSGLNNYWQSGVNSFYSKITGKTYSESVSGTGVASEKTVTTGSCTCSLSTNGDGVASGKFTWPAPGVSRITSPFGNRYIFGSYSMHKGMDIGCPSGTNIVASDGGTVILASMGYNGGYGNLVKIQHADGYETRYAHLSSISVKLGQKVSKGQVVAKSGSTGDSTGPHLHFEVRQGGEAKNPALYVKA